MAKTNIWQLDKHFNIVWKAHDQQASAKINRVRLWDKHTPYAIHPIWCATTLLTETSLPESMRYDGALTLLYHDLLEDTSANVNVSLSPKIKRWIQAMTFPGGFEEEKKALFTRDKQIRLLKLYDKTSNLLDSSWMPSKLLHSYLTLTKKLVTDVQKNFGDLNITSIAKSVIKRNT